MLDCRKDNKLYVDADCTDHVYCSETDCEAGWETDKWKIDEGTVCLRVSLKHKKATDTLSHTHAKEPDEKNANGEQEKADSELAILANGWDKWAGSGTLPDVLQ